MRRGRHLDEDPIGTRPARSIRGGFLAVALVALTGCGTDVPPLDPAGLASADSLVASWVDARRIPGAVLVVMHDGVVAFEQAYGVADAQDGEAMTTGTVFDLASVTKVMATTYAVMMLADRGQLNLDAPVETYLPDFTGEGREGITVRHLLTHRSGLPQWVPTYYHASNADEAWAYIRGLPLTWPPGAERHYSDLGFMVLGRIVESVSGAPLDRFVARELYGPLGLRVTGFRPARVDATGGSEASGPVAASDQPEPAQADDIRFAHTSHGNPFERRMVHDPAFGYTIEGDPDAWNGWRDHWLDGEVNDGNAWHAFEGVAGHAGLFSTARELATLLQLVLDGGRFEGRELIARETIDLFLESSGDRQAPGWQLPGFAPPGAFGHTGFTGTFVLGVPSSRLALVLLTNRQNFGVDDETQYPDVSPLQRAVTAAVTGTR